MPQAITISTGFMADERDQVARLYWQAFQGKLGRVMHPEARALAFIAEALDPDFALCARDPAGGLLGVAGFKTAQGGLLGGDLPDLMRHYGRWGGLWRGLLLSVLERDTQAGILQMDGIFVSPEARGQGAGGALLDAITDEARARGCTRVRLDVIDTNPRAQALYERKGFIAMGREETGPFRWVFGFRSATRMERPVP